MIYPLDDVYVHFNTTTTTATLLSQSLMMINQSLKKTKIINYWHNTKEWSLILHIETQQQQKNEQKVKICSERNIFFKKVSHLKIKNNMMDLKKQKHLCLLACVCLGWGVGVNTVE